MNINTLDPDSVELAILCGGRGVRMKAHTDHTPKALVPVYGRPMLDHIVDFFGTHGFRRFTLCVGYKAHRIREHFQKKQHDPQQQAQLEIHYSDVGESASMLQRLWALRHTPKKRILVIYGDTFINLDLEQWINHHMKSGAAATIVTAKIQNPFGIVHFDENHWISDFQEKPIHNHYIGCLVMERSAFDCVEESMLSLPDGEGLVTFFKKLAQEQKLSAFVHSGLQITFNTETELRRAEQELGKYFTYPEVL